MSSISSDDVQHVRKYIRDTWASVTRYPSHPHKDEIHLPKSFTVPDPPEGPFRSFFYWDTFYTSLGLWIDNHHELARNNALDMLYLIEKYGFIPNTNGTGQHDFSQPPHASLQVRMDYDHTHDKEFLRYAVPLLEQEYGFWLSYRSSAGGLAHYYHHGNPNDIRKSFEGYKHRLHNMPADVPMEWSFTSHAMAEVESGWDFTPRFSRRCGDFLAIDLNSLLYLYEQNAAYFCQELGDAKAAKWLERGANRKKAMQELLWNPQQQFYCDRDMLHRVPSPLRTAAGIYALLAGVATPEQADAMRRQLPVLERDHGLATVEPGIDEAGQPYQWNYPNGWAPLQYAAIAGLTNYQLHDDARRIASKFVATAIHVFKKTHRLWEKYNVTTGDIDVVNEYPHKPMMGWTAGVFLYACKTLGL
ncbi:MAG TPA: trehalase family glycosidase [Tepidisphaeraceae bacterium]|jgi:alpha,alpha-trehalase